MYFESFNNVNNALSDAHTALVSDLAKVLSETEPKKGRQICNTSVNLVWKFMYGDYPKFLHYKQPSLINLSAYHSPIRTPKCIIG